MGQQLIRMSRPAMPYTTATPQEPPVSAEAPAASSTAPQNGSEPTADAKLAALQDSYLRVLADMENLRTRTKKEVEAAGQFSIQKFAKDIVSVADVLEMALASGSGRKPVDAEKDIPPADDAPAAGATATAADGAATGDVLAGLQMTLDELHAVFRRHGLTPIDPLHQRFDPNQHMALYEVPAAHLEPGVVVSVQKKGYLLNGRVIRAAQVAVSKKP